MISLSVTAAFSVAILLVFALMGLRRKSYSQTASILTSLGILGTFVGVTMALVAFNTNDIQSSVPALLDGMKVAFLTSVLGILCAVLLRMTSALSQSNSKKSEGKTADDIADLLQLQVQQDQKRSVELRAIRSALVGDGDTTLLSQIKHMRQDGTDQHKASMNAFEEFSKTLSEQNSKALIEALREVIRDFNAKITEQFGENFKELNTAVGRLLKWQDNYKSTLVDTLAALQAVQSGVERMDQSLGSITQNAESLTTSAGHLEHLLGAIRTLEEQLEQRLAAFAGLSQEAQEAFPKIRKNLDELTGGMKREVLEAVAAQENMNGKMAESFEGLRELNEKFTSSITETTTGAIDRMSTAVRDSVTTSTEQLDKNLANMERQLRSLSESNTQTIQRQVQQLDEDLGEALTKSLTSLGNQLATLSGKFVEDYQPLTDRLQRIVQISQGVQ